MEIHYVGNHKKQGDAACRGYQRDAHGGRDAGAAHHLYGHHPMLSKGVSVDLVKTQNPISMQAADKSDAIVVAVTPRWKNLPEHLPDDCRGPSHQVRTC